ncbi:hypothetical protein A9P82_12085 [Arachidicoccus ginsenosidimutans]|nr:hypothetical protein A9P82_12085 [Arachidicoccus sp. BS20]
MVLFFAGCKKNPPAAKILTSIAVTTPPVKTAYTIGDTFDPTGMVVTATYSDKSTSEITITANMLSYDFSTVGNKTVTITYDGQTTTFTGITVNAALAITGFSPAEAQHDSIITITGVSFNPTPANNIVAFNGIAATVVSATTTQLTVKVPKDKNSSGKISVTVANNTATSATNFTYVFTAVVSTLTVGGGNPLSIVLDASDNMYTNNFYSILKITSVGIVSDMNVNFGSVDGLALDGQGNLYVASGSYSTIYKIILSTGEISTLAGNGGQGLTNGFGTAATFNYPSGLTFDGHGNLYVADLFNDAIRKIVIATGQVTTLAGGNGGLDVNYPKGVALDTAGNVYVANYGGSNILRISPTGSVNTLAGSGYGGIVDGKGAAAQFLAPAGIVYDGIGNLYVADITAIRKIVISTGVVTTIAGSGGFGGRADGVGAAAQFSQANAIVMDTSGNLYVADENDGIRKITFE